MRLKITVIMVVMGALLFGACSQSQPSVPTSAPTSEPATPAETDTPLPAATISAPQTATPTAPPQLVSPLSPVSPPATPQAETLPFISAYKIVNVYPHDRSAFTQGLVFEDGIFYEGTGYYGFSDLRKVKPETGEVLQSHKLPLDEWGEGITIFEDKVYQITWKAQKGYVYDKESFELLKEFSYPTQGWGITHDGEKLIMSDGTANLYFWDPETLEEIGRVEVHDANGPVININELEYVNGEVYANIWTTEQIARINPQTGEVVGWILLPNLLTQEDKAQQVDVLNGIAYDAENDRLFVTGKWWPKLFEIALIPAQ